MIYLCHNYMQRGSNMVEMVAKPRHAPSSIKRDALYEKFKTKISINPALDRALVSFQASTSVHFSNWFKYKEGFSEALVTYLLQHITTQPGILLDPFAG